MADTITRQRAVGVLLSRSLTDGRVVVRCLRVQCRTSLQTLWPGEGSRTMRTPVSNVSLLCAAVDDLSSG